MSVYFEGLVQFVSCVVIELPEALLDATEVLLACIDVRKELRAEVLHLTDISPHTDELLKLVDHLVTAAQDRRQSLNLIQIFLIKAAALTEESLDVIAGNHILDGFFAIDELNDASWVVGHAFLVH